MNIQQWVNAWEKKVPLSLQEEWDHSGKQLGRFSRELTGIVYSLDLSEESIQEAVKNHCNLIFTHHPVFFDPVKSFTEDQPMQDLAIECIEKGFCIYSSHTCFDTVFGGVNDVLAEMLGLSDLDPLVPSGLMDPLHAYSDGFGKIGTFAERPAKPLTYHLNKWKKIFHMSSIPVFGPANILVESAACVGGSGADYIPYAIQRGADVFITGDIRYHQAQEAVAQGLTVVDLGHYESEAPALYRAMEWSKQIAPGITHRIVPLPRDRIRQFF